MTHSDKQIALDILRKRTEQQRGQLASVDSRLVEYYDGLITEPNYHNGYELLCAVKLLRLMRTFEVDADEVQRTQPLTRSSLMSTCRHIVKRNEKSEMQYKNDLRIYGYNDGRGGHTNRAQSPIARPVY
jgi:hypothetical protein